MLTRREFSKSLTLGAILSPSIFHPVRVWADEPETNILDQLDFPPFGALDAPEKFGYSPATQAQIKKADDIIKQTPVGPTPIDVAESFVTRFGQSDPDAISQWPAPDSWNPLVKEFFSATTLKANNDMIDWCAAFVNWSIKRAGWVHTNSASSQSFIDKKFTATPDPDRGDLAIFTCYEVGTGNSLHLGHVGFVAEKPDLSSNEIMLLSGNTTGDGHSSIIMSKPFPIKPRRGRRHVNGVRVPCVVKLNRFAKIPRP